MKEKTILELIEEYVRKTSPNASEEEIKKAVKSRALSLLRV